MKQSLGIFLITLTFFGAISQAGISVRCPSTAGKLPFKNVRLYDGNPKQNLDIQPYNEEDPFPHRWLVKGTEPWYACEYGSRSRRLISKKIEVDIDLCRSAESVKGSGKFDSIRCE